MSSQKVTWKSFSFALIVSGQHVKVCKHNKEEYTNIQEKQGLIFPNRAAQFSKALFIYFTFLQWPLFTNELSKVWRLLE